MALALLDAMPRTPKLPQSREDEDESIASGPPQVDEVEPDDDRAQVKLYDEDTVDLEDEDLAEEIYLDDLAAMEGPDA